MDQVANWNKDSRLTPDILKECQRLAVNQIYRCAGYFRDGPVTLQGDNITHVPPDHTEVAGLVSEMCDYVSDNWHKKVAVHLAAFLMWRMNWIHPFYGGNGRTARAISYLVMCARLGFQIPGTKTIPEMIDADRRSYYLSLRSADAAWAEGRLDISEMEDLMSGLLAKQLLQIHTAATGIRVD